MGGQIGYIFLVIGLSELAASMGNHFKMVKPFNCSFCLTFWFSIPISYLYANEMLPFIGYTLIIRQIVWKLLY